MTPLVQQPALVVARALHFWALSTMLGGAAFVLLLRRPVGILPGRVLRGAAALAALTDFIWFACVFIDVTGEPGALLDAGMWSAFMTTVFGPPWAIQLGLSGLGLGLALTTRPAPFLVVGALLAIDQAWLGHAATAQGAAVAWAIAFYALHVLAGFAWTGALVMLCAVGVEERRVPRDGLRLFSGVGIVIVAAILASGIVNASFRLQTIADLSTTTYGAVLSVKIGLFAVMVLLAALNRRKARRAEAATRGPVIGVGLETGLGLAVLCAAAVLGISAPPG